MSTTAIDGASRARQRTLEDDPSPIAAKTGQRCAPAELARGAVAAKIDSDVAAFIANVLDPKPIPKNDDILYIGVNAQSASSESRALEAGGGRVHHVHVSTNDVSDIRAFVDALGVPKQVSDRIAQVLEQASPGEREMLAAIAWEWAAAERGGACPSRLAISGHSGGGSEIFSYEGQLTLKNVRRLAEAMPHAASQVEDVHLSACSTSGNGADPKEWRAAFPNMKSLWCYDGSAPSPASAHLAAWSQMTRGRNEPRVTESLKRANVGLWTASRGYEEKHRTLETVRKDAGSARAQLPAYVDGTSAPDHGEHNVVQSYRALRRLSARPDATPAERAQAKVDADVVLRVRYYASVRTQFSKTHGAAVASGFRAVGLAPPDFARMSRKEALAAIASFEAAAARHVHPPRAAAFVAPTLRGFANLDPNVVPERWCAE
jgi:hypothetical protein